jgi:hypothetical protein
MPFAICLVYPSLLKTSALHRLLHLVLQVNLEPHMLYPYKDIPILPIT